MSTVFFPGRPAAALAAFYLVAGIVRVLVAFVVAVVVIVFLYVLVARQAGALFVAAVAMLPISFVAPALLAVTLPKRTGRLNAGAVHAYRRLSIAALGGRGRRSAVAVTVVAPLYLFVSVVVLALIVGISTGRGGLTLFWTAALSIVGAALSTVVRPPGLLLDAVPMWIGARDGRLAERSQQRTPEQGAEEKGKRQPSPTLA